MPRRNRKTTPTDRLYGQASRPSLNPAENDRRREFRRERDSVMRDSWFASSVDWTTCVVPGCKYQTQKNLQGTGITFPICTLHAVAAWESVEALDKDPHIRQAHDALAARRDAIRLEREQLDAQDAAEYREDLKSDLIKGDLYFVRTHNGLVKVGWTSDMHRRLRAYGPTAELLVYYPGSQADEKLLHQQLTPCRAKGREWYHDADIIADFVERLIAKHGKPLVKVEWTDHQAHGAAPRRAARKAS